LEYYLISDIETTTCHKCNNKYFIHFFVIVDQSFNIFLYFLTFNIFLYFLILGISRKYLLFVVDIMIVPVQMV